MQIRTVLAATTIVGTLVAATIGFVDRGESADQQPAEACESAVWPAIPATCLGKPQILDVDKPVEMAVEADVLVDKDNQPNPLRTSGKADRLQPIEVGNARYRTVERRADGVSILTRVMIQ